MNFKKIERKNRKLSEIHNIGQLNPKRSIYVVLSSIFSNPSLLRNTEIFLEQEDFYDAVHRLIFMAAKNIVSAGEKVEKIKAIDVDNYLAGFEKLYNIWEKEGGVTYTQTLEEYESNVDSFLYHYKQVKKYSLLRDYLRNGVDISDIFDFQNPDLRVNNDGKKRIEEMELDEIVEYFAYQMNDLRNRWSISKNSKNFKAGDGLDTLLEELNEAPDFGYPFQNGFYNTIFNGMRPGKFMLRSASTGGGKTRQSLADMCSISCAELWDLNTRTWRSAGVVKPTLFISTELEKRELQTVMLAFITGIPEQDIKQGKYTEKTLKRLKHGIEVLKQAPIFAVYVDDFSIVDIESIIEQYIIQENVEFVAFDYIQMTPKLARSMSSSFGSNLREDQILVQFSAAMKILANKYGIYIISSTQLNRNSKEFENRDTQSLRGGSATADKVDHGVMSFRATSKDHENLKHILETNQYEKPNFSHWVYKNRSGTNNVVIWTRMDMSTMREEPLFVTDTDFQLMEDIEIMKDVSFAQTNTGFDLEAVRKEKERQKQMAEVQAAFRKKQQEQEEAEQQENKSVQQEFDFDEPDEPEPIKAPTGFGAGISQKPKYELPFTEEETTRDSLSVGDDVIPAF